MLGELMYIVPVLKIGVKKMGVYLPKGTWIHLWVGHGNSCPACLFAFMPGLTEAIYYRPESKLPIRKVLGGQLRCNALSGSHLFSSVTVKPCSDL